MTTTDNDGDFAQFAGTFDRPATPSPAFTESLRRKVFQADSDGAIDPSAGQNAVQVEPLPARDTVGGAAVKVHRAWPHIPRHFQAAAAILIAISLVSSLALYRQPDEPYRLLFQPSPEDASIEVNQGGNPGRTWNFGDAEPDLGDSLQPLSEDSDWAASPYNGFVVGDSLIAQIYTGNLQKLVRYDLNSKSVLWSETYPIAGPIASGGARIFAVSETFTSGISSSQLIAIDFETGRVDWLGPLLASRASGATSLVLMNNTVFVADLLGNMMAVDPGTGSVIWSNPDTISTPTSDETSKLDGLPPNLVGSEHGLYVANSSGEVSRIDAATGQKLETFEASGGAEDRGMYVTLSATGSHLLARVAHEPDNSGQASVDLLVLDPQSLEMTSELQVSAIASNVVLLGDSAFFAVAEAAGEPAQLVAMDLESGMPIEPVAGVTAEQFLFLSASGGTLMVTTDRGDVIFVDTRDHSILFQQEIPFDIPAFPRPPLMWNDDPIIIPGDGNIYGFFTNPAVGATPSTGLHGTSGRNGTLWS